MNGFMGIAMSRYINEDFPDEHHLIFITCENFTSLATGAFIAGFNKRIGNSYAVYPIPTTEKYSVNKFELSVPGFTNINICRATISGAEMFEYRCKELKKKTFITQIEKPGANTRDNALSYAFENYVSTKVLRKVYSKDEIKAIKEIMKLLSLYQYAEWRDSNKDNVLILKKIHSFYIIYTFDEMLDILINFMEKPSLDYLYDIFDRTYNDYSTTFCITTLSSFFNDL